MIGVMSTNVLKGEILSGYEAVVSYSLAIFITTFTN